VWTYTSNAFRGEDADGSWRLKVSDRWAFAEGRLRAATLDLLGAADDGDDVYVFTDEYGLSARAGFGHGGAIRDRDGGTDTINAAAVTAPVSIDLATGQGAIGGDRLRLRGEFEDVATGDGWDWIGGSREANVLDGGRGGDRIGGHRGADVIRGGPGPDRLFGGGGRDEVRGGGGADVIADGRGSDRLVGGAGPDVFVMRQDGADDGIADFADGVDLIRLEGLRFRALTLADAGDSVRIDYAGERLFVGSHGALAAADFTAADFLFA
jgi:Ca2+-binding RTX toxin-like protein